jgi:ubiquitin thioesterase protein OTUB1
MCQYGTMCYRNTSEHFAKYDHPADHELLIKEPAAAAAVASGDELPDGWEMRFTSEGRAFYANLLTKTTQWERPLPPLPPGWEQRHNENGRPFYVNLMTKATQWKRPDNFLSKLEMAEKRDQMNPAPRLVSPPHVKPQESSAHPTPLVAFPVDEMELAIAESLRSTQHPSIHPKEHRDSAQTEAADVQAALTASLEIAGQQEDDRRPLVAGLLPLNALMAEYTNSRSADLYHATTQTLSARYESIRRIRGDGNCFYRAFFVSWMGRLLGLPVEQQSDVWQRIVPSMERELRLHLPAELAELLPALGRTVADHVRGLCTPASATAAEPGAVHHDEAGSQGLREVGESDEAGSQELREVGESDEAGPVTYEARWLRAVTEPATATKCIQWLRLVTSAYMRSNRDGFEPFLQKPFETFLAEDVETMNVEAEEMHIVALTKALQLRVRVEYFDPIPRQSAYSLRCGVHRFVVRGPAELDARTSARMAAETRLQSPRMAAETRLQSPARSDRDGTMAMRSRRPVAPLVACLLFRPGHYDVLVPRSWDGLDPRAVQAASVAVEDAAVEEDERTCEVFVPPVAPEEPDRPCGTCSERLRACVLCASALCVADGCSSRQQLAPGQPPPRTAPSGLPRTAREGGASLPLPGVPRTAPRPGEPDWLPLPPACFTMPTEFGPLATSAPVCAECIERLPLAQPCVQPCAPAAGANAAGAEAAMDMAAESPLFDQLYRCAAAAQPCGCGVVDFAPRVHRHALQCASERVACLYSECTQSLPRRERGEHLLVCEHAPLRCEHAGCDAVFPRHLMAEHAAVCKFALQTCDDCAERLVRLEMASHRATCPKRPVPCSACGEALPLDAHAQHMAQVCPEREVRCARLGCGLRFSARQRTAHDATCPGALVACIWGCGMTLERRALRAHQQECPRAWVRCPGCPAEVSHRRGEVRSHHGECPGMPYVCLYCDKLVLRASQDVHERETCEVLCKKSMFECVICTVEDECGTVPHFEPDCFVRGCAADDDHRCHFECIENYVRNEITKWPDTTSEKLKCPGPGCMGRRELPQCEITPHQVHGMQGLERSIKEKYDRILNVRVLREAHGDSLKACPRGCGYFVLAPNARQKWMPCKICREPDGSELVMCLECGEPHDRRHITCAQHAEFKRQNAPDFQAERMMELEQFGVFKRCPGPSCNVPITKAGGCQHMDHPHDLGGCGYAFCWHCLAPHAVSTAHDASFHKRECLLWQPAGGEDRFLNRTDRRKKPGEFCPLCDAAGSFCNRRPATACRRDSNGDTSVEGDMETVTHCACRHGCGCTCTMELVSRCKCGDADAQTALGEAIKKLSADDVRTFPLESKSACICGYSQVH